jgi:hypothetical protein
MIESLRTVAEVPVSERRDGIQWLALEPERISKGWLLLLFEVGPMPVFPGSQSQWDYWFQTRDAALASASRRP